MSEEDIHTMPNDDKHICSPKCWCEPTVSYQDEETGVKVWLHKGYEGLINE